MTEHMKHAERVIFHLDIDYFFAHAEEIRNPDYKNMPLLVCVYTDAPASKGVIATANYIARKFGVHSGMPIFQARKLLEGHEAVFLAGDFDYYQQISDGMAGLLGMFSDKVERASVDEWFVDITMQTDGDWECAGQIARSIKKEVLAKYSLTCSVGIAPNKLVAKIATGFKKPDGLMIVRPDEVQKFLDPLEIGAVPGIGKKTRELLAPFKLKTIADIRAMDATLLVEKFGKLMAGWLYRASRGIDGSEVVIWNEQKQISRITTLKKHSRDYDELLTYATPLIKELLIELKKAKLVCGTVGVLGIDSEMRMHTKAKTLQHPIDNAKDIESTAEALLNDLVGSTTIEFRRIGVKIERLESKKGQKRLNEFR